MKKLLFLILCIAALTLTACQMPPELQGVVDSLLSSLNGGTQLPDEPNGGNTGNNNTVGGYQDPTHKRGTYKVEFKLYSSSVIHYYEKDEMPEPPEVENSVEQFFVYVFTGWDKTMSAVSGDTVYEAQYERQDKIYTARFRVADGRSINVKTRAGVAPIPPATPDYKGMKFACWDKEVDVNYDDVTYTAIYTDVTDPAGMRMAWREEVNGQRLQSTFQALHMMTSIYTLVLQEYKNPFSDLVAQRAADHLSAMVASEAGLPFDCSTNWQYGITAATIAMASKTPSVWNKISNTNRVRLRTMMEALAYIGSFGTSDYNDYSTGPSLGGNYRKGWNPNYRLGNIPGMAFITYFFGDGNLEQGSAIVNEMITSFDEAAYDNMIKRFTDYNWKTALAVWTTDGIVLENGQSSTSKAKELLIHGGPAIAKSIDGQSITGCGSGVGVANGGRDYLYQGYTLAQADQILRAVIIYNFSGGAVTNEHWHEGQKLAWIADGTQSPYQGQEGMMKEFNSGNRSSTVYCDHDFTIAIPLLSCARELYRYDENGRVERDAFGNPVSLYDCTTDAELWTKIQVGTEDFIYKITHGYQSYSTGSYGEASGVHSIKDVSRGYTTVKALWRYSLLPLGTVTPCDQEFVLG